MGNLFYYFSCLGFPFTLKVEICSLLVFIRFFKNNLISQNVYYNTFLCRHTDSRAAMKDGRTFSAVEDDMADVYPLLLRLSVLRETNSLGVKVTKKVSSFY